MKRWGLLSIVVPFVGLLLAGCEVIIGPPRGRVVVAPPPIVVETEPRVVLIPETDVYYAPDVATADLYVVGGVWFYFHDDHWFRGRSYRGPWVFVEERRLPPGLRKIPPGFRRHAPGRDGRREHGRDD